MKRLTLTIFSILVLNSAQAQEVKRLSEPVQVTDQFEVFGEAVEFETITPMLLSTAIEKKAEEVFLVTEVKEVCAKKGCFFIASDGDLTARVTFKDYGFFIPTDSGGKEVILKGVLSEKILTEDQAKHYAEDAGKDPDLIKGEQREYSVVATSVIVPKS